MHERGSHHHDMPMVDEVVDDAPVRFAKRAAVDAETDITPMIDMTFLLLIFFLVASRIDVSPSVDLPTAKNGGAVPVNDSVFLTIDRGIEDSARIFLGDGLNDASEVLAANPQAQEGEILRYLEKELASTPRKHQVVVKAAQGLKYREVARVLEMVGKVDSVERVHVGVLEGQ